MSVPLLLEMATQFHPDRPALRAPDGALLDFAGYRDRVVAAAGLLRERGAQRVVLLGETTAAFPVALFAAAWAGLPFVPVNHRLPVDRIHELLERLPGACVVRGAGVTVPAGMDVLSEAELISAPPSGLDRDEGDRADADGTAVELFTSGTTGPPRLTSLTHANLFSYVTNTVELGAAAEDEALLLATPPFHIAAVAAVLTSCYAGRRLIPLGRFTPEGWLRAAAAEHATHAFLVPTMLARVLDTLHRTPDRPAPALRSLSYGGARMPRPTIELALRAFPHTDFVNAYGLTETSSTIAVLGPDDHRAAALGDPIALERLDSVGRVLPGVEVRLVDTAGGPVPPGASGMVEVRGAQVASGGLTGGWLRTGDTGRVDADGYLFLGGRSDDIIIKGGENLAPGEIEDVILRHPAVAAVAVVGLPDSEWGERVAAAVVPRAGTAEPEAIREWVRRHLGSLKTPDVIKVLDELPETATGKVPRARVRALLESRQPAAEVIR
ncbi:class I adenylate-forming enzyme family protein [Dactylosporangium sp. NPDC000555]|uniref:class I adenylate-forming enzyme family protein n=1 Tax=Dactylosporangium sp. NPDC000555 TaxID=3154260 RepID=UPI00331B4C25